jgi:hypothetical protein
MTIVDLTGMAITEIRDFPAVTAIVGQKTRSEWAAGETPPGVIVRALAIDYDPGGGTRRLGLQAPIFAALCYGATRIQASQLANAVVEAVNMRGPRKTAAGKLVWQSLVDGGGDVELDPVTKWPFATVTFTYLGAQQAAAVA